MVSNTAAGSVTEKLRGIHALAESGDLVAAQGAVHQLVQQQPIIGSLCLKLACLLGNPLETADPLQGGPSLRKLRVPTSEELAQASGLLDPLLPLHRLERAAWRSQRNGELFAAVVVYWQHLASLKETTRPQRLGKVCALISAAFARGEGEGGLEAAASWALFASRRVQQSIPLWISAARYNAAVGRWDACREAAGKALELSKENRVGASYLSLADLALGDREAAAARLKKFGLHHGIEFLSMLTLELVRLDQENWPQPLELNSGASTIPKAPAKPAQSANKAKRLLIEDKVDEALALLDEAASAELVSTERLTSAIEWLYLRGYALFHLKRPAEAYACFAAAIIPQPAEQTLLSGLGQTARQFERPAEGLSYFLEILPQGPDDFGAFFYAGLCYDALGERQLALKALNEAFGRFFYDNLELNFRPLYGRVLGAGKFEAESQSEVAA